MGEGEGIAPPLFQPRMPFRFPLPSILCTARFLLCFLVVTGSAYGLAVNRVELRSAFRDGDDVICLIGATCALRPADLAGLVSGLDCSRPCDLLGARCGAVGWVVGPAHGSALIRVDVGHRVRSASERNAVWRDLPVHAKRPRSPWGHFI